MRDRFFNNGRSLNLQNVRFNAARVISVLAVVSFLAIISTYTILYTGPTKPDVTGQLLIPEATTLTSVDGAAFAFLALGAQAYQMNCAAAIESLVRFGGWGGDVYLITDRKSCFDVDEIVRNAGMDSNKFHLKVIGSEGFSGDIDLTNPMVGFSASRQKSKSMKTRLFEVITDPHIHTLGYADCDILFAIKNCPVEMLNSGDPWGTVKLKFSRAQFTDDMSELEELHSGALVMHREYSKEALRLWREALDKHESDLDRVPYMNLYKTFQAQLKTDSIRSSASSGRKLLLRGAVNKTQEIHRKVQHHETNMETVYKPHRNVSNARSNRPASIASSTFQAPPTSSNSINPVMPSPLYKIVNGKRVGFETFVSQNTVVPMCMNHISKARCLKYGRFGFALHCNA
jgi:hypothetical protein